MARGRNSKGRFVAGNTEAAGVKKAGGRPPNLQEIKDLLHNITPKAVEVIYEILCDENRNARDRLSAARAVLERVVPIANENKVVLDQDSLSKLSEFLLEQNAKSAEPEAT